MPKRKVPTTAEVTKDLQSQDASISHVHFQRGNNLRVNIHYKTGGISNRRIYYSRLRRRWQLA